MIGKLPTKIWLLSFRVKDPVRRLLPHVVIVAVALIIGLYRVNTTGPLWADAPQYANAAAMIYDWLRSGNLLEPYHFAKLNYSQYPAFSVPYHPVGYPFILGTVFLFTGVSYLAARSFVALCLGISGCVYFAILQRLKYSKGASFLGALLLISMPEIIWWSRDTMSEIPALMFILSATLLFQSWLETPRPKSCWGAFALAVCAFQSRLSTIAIIPQWFFVLMWQRRWRQLFSRQFLLAGILLFTFCISWIAFALGFSRYETWDNHNPARVPHFSWENISYYPSRIPAMAGWTLTIAAIAGVIYTLASLRRRRNQLQLFWLFWFLAYYGYQLSIAANEQRHFLLALPSLPGLALLLVGTRENAFRGRLASFALLAAALALNLIHLFQMPAGIVGYDAVAKALNTRSTPGNVLVATYYDQELIFRFRGLNKESRRQMIRSDRSLAIRLPEYSGVRAQILAHQPEDLFDIVLRGRVRYLLTCSPEPGRREDRSQEMILAHSVAESHPDKFALLGKFPLLLHIGGSGKRSVIYLWEYRDRLPAGPSEIPVVIPTANLKFNVDR